MSQIGQIHEEIPTISDKLWSRSWRRKFAPDTLVLLHCHVSIISVESASGAHKPFSQREAQRAKHSGTNPAPSLEMQHSGGWRGRAEQGEKPCCTSDPATAVALPAINPGDLGLFSSKSLYYIVSNHKALQRCRGSLKKKQQPKPTN